MHTTDIGEDGKGRTTFHHNGDFSGLVDIVERGPEGEKVNLVNVPMAHIEQFVAEKQRQELIRYLDGMPLDKSHIRDEVYFLHRQVFRSA